MASRRMHMKANHLTLAVTLLSLGSFGFAQEQTERGIPQVIAANEVAAPAETQVAPEVTTAAANEVAAPAEAQVALEEPTAAAAPAKIPAILTKVVESKKLSGQDAEVTAVPIAAVFNEEGKFFVLAKGAESDVNFTQLEVEVGKTDGTFVEITAGLAPGDEVIVVSSAQVKAPVVAEVGQAQAPTVSEAGQAYGVRGCPTNTDCEIPVHGNFYGGREYYDEPVGFYGGGSYRGGGGFNRGGGSFCR